MPSLVPLSCTRCGGSFDFEALEPVAVCPYCRTAQPLPQEILAQAQQYQRAVEVEDERADLKQLIAARYAALEPAAWTGVILWLGFTIPVIAGIGIAFAGVGGKVSLAALGGLGAVFALSATVSLFRLRSAHAGLARTAFSCTCPSCGGTNAMEVGQTFATCEYCQAALVPGERVAAVGLGLARTRTRAAEQNAIAASRRFRITADQRNRIMGTLMAGTSPLLPGIITVYSYGQYQQGLAPLGQVVFGAVATAVLIVAPFGLAAVRSVRSAGFQQAMKTLASRQGAAELDGVIGTVGWLNDFWPEEYGEYYDLQPTAMYRVVALSVRGFPVLVAGQPGKYLHIVVATGALANEPRCKPLTQDGFQLRSSPSGVMASVRGKPLTALPVADRLPAAVDALVDSVAGAGGRPAARR